MGFNIVDGTGSDYSHSYLGISIKLLDINDDNKDTIIGYYSKFIPSEYVNIYHDVLSTTFDNLSIFDIEELKGSVYEGEDETLDLIIPTINNIFHKVFTKPPMLFKNSLDQSRLKLFQLSFDIDEFNKYLIEMLVHHRRCLFMFSNLDRINETLEIIVNNYLAILIHKVHNVDNVYDEIRILERDRDIKNILK